MSLVTVVLTLIVVGFVFYPINRFIRMEGRIKSILNVVVVVAVMIWLLYGFGVISGSSDIKLPELN